MGHRKHRLLFCLIFFLICYVYVWIVVKPALIFHGFGTLILNVPQFSTGWQSLKDSLNVPGGLVVYLYGLLSQGYAYSWLGAMIIVGAAFSLCELSRQHCIVAGHSRSTLIHYFPGIMVLLIYNHYDHPLAACLTVCAGLLFSWGLEKLPVHRRTARLGIFCAMAAISFWLAGSGGMFVFSLVTSATLLFLRRDGWSAMVTLPAAAIINWALAEYVFHLSPAQAFAILTPFSKDLTANMNPFSQVLVVMLYLFVPVTVSVTGAWQMAAGRMRDMRAAHPHKKKGRKAGGITWSQNASLAIFKRFVAAVVPVAMLAVGLYFTHSSIHRQIVQMNYLARQKQWSDVIELGRQLPKTVYNVYCNHDINRALYHTGRLGSDLFSFPQNPQALLLTHEQEESCITQLKLCDVFIEMGNVDDAERLASEFLVDKGNAGFILEKLAWINIIKAQEPTAEMYLNALKKDLIYGHKAEAMLKGLRHGFDANEATAIGQARAFRQADGRARLYRKSVEAMLIGLLEHNPHNRMAFEYLMTTYLLTGQLEKLAARMGHLKDLGYQDVPVLYEEAALLYHAMRSERLNLTQLNIRRATFERYKRFVTLANSIQTRNRQAVLQQLVRESGTSYFFYYQFELSRLAGMSQDASL